MCLYTKIAFYQTKYNLKRVHPDFSFFLQNMALDPSSVIRLYLQDYLAKDGGTGHLHVVKEAGGVLPV